jgi:hypothetical protein
MRRFARIAGGSTGVVLATVAVAIAVTNTYSLSGSVVPVKSGTSSRPAPAQIAFNYQVGEVTGQRPATVSKYDIAFQGIQENSNAFRACSNSRLNNAGPSTCPSGSKIGTGRIENVAGQSSNPSDKSISCHLDLTLYNGGAHSFELYLFGSAHNPNGTCPVDVHQAIHARLIKRGEFVHVIFSVPTTLLHPLPGLDNAVTQVVSKIPRKTTTVRKRVHGRTRRVTVGLLASYFCPRNRQRQFSVTFTTERGQVTTTTATMPCT